MTKFLFSASHDALTMRVLGMGSGALFALDRLRCPEWWCVQSLTKFLAAVALARRLRFLSMLIHLEEAAVEGPRVPSPSVPKTARGPLRI